MNCHFVFVVFPSHYIEVTSFLQLHWTKRTYVVVLHSWSANNCLFYSWGAILRNTSSCACDSAHGQEMFMLMWSFISVFKHVIASFPAGSTHSFCHPGCIWMWLSELPRAALPSSYSVSGGGGPKGEHLIVDHHGEGPPGGLHVGECFHTTVLAHYTQCSS